ncbi:MAG: helix-turn-helix transcriptional regulator [Desulfuromonadales bacterium]|nr:helix-turn-helix transcriptional regulator [Desulfuromonadales bacterium]
MSLHETPSVSIDGHAIRRIREEKRLTQLYVAKVVGVTTDTVSRWENNRYPTIRRDNAVKLADALDVTLEVILKQEHGSVIEMPSPASRNRWPVVLLGLLLLAGGAWFFAHRQVEVSDDIHATRLQPRYAAPGSRILIRLQLEMDRPYKGVIIKERFPQGWTLVDAIPPPSSLGTQDSARWMLRNPASRTTISYLLEVAPEVAGGQAQITGEIITNPDGQRASVPIAATQVMETAPLHWVDEDGNQVIDDVEILDISDLFEESEIFRKEWEQIEELWDAGGYRWDPQLGRFVPAPVH